MLKGINVLKQRMNRKHVWKFKPAAESSAPLAAVSLLDYSIRSLHLSLIFFVVKEKSITS